MRYAEHRRQKKQEEEKYWRWLKGMKDEVAKRPCSAPPARSSGAESASSMAFKRSMETRREWQAIGSEYHSWVRSVSVPKFQLPTPKTDNEERTKRLLQRRKRR